MKRIYSLLTLVLALVLAMTGFAVAEAGPAYELGGKIDDFTVTTYDGQTVTLSEVLKEKEAVMINIWATWCGPCRGEFPYMQEAYAQYADKVEIIALSCEPTDTDDVLAQFAADMGLTFKVAQDTVDMASKLYATAIPTTIVVDRFGTICFWHEGSLPDTGSFTRLFDAFLGEGYTESEILMEIPKQLPNVAPATEADLAAALNADGAALTFFNGEDAYDWPMTVAEKDGRQVVVSSNAAVGDSTARVLSTVTAKPGDAIVVTFKTSTEAACDLLTLALNGETVKVFGGEHDWMTYAIPVEADGEYALSIAYAKDIMMDDGEDAVWVDTVALVSGDDATAALAANPQYPATADALTLTVLNGKEMQFTESFPGALASNFGDTVYYVVDGAEAKMTAALPAGVDPEGAFFYNGYDGSQPALTTLMTAEGYAYTSVIDTTATTGYNYSMMNLYADATGMNVASVMLFAGEEEANAFMDYVNQYGLGITGWTYADGTAPATDARPGAAATIGATYTFTCVDQNGAAVPGVIINVCTDDSCQPMVADENGVVTFTGDPYAYHIQVIGIPEGYDFDKTQEFYTSTEGGEMVFTLTKN